MPGWSGSLMNARNIWSIFGPLLCLKFANTLFTRICRKFEKWCNLRVLSGKFLRRKSCCPEIYRFFWLWSRILLHPLFVCVILRKQTLPEQFLKSRSYRGLNYFLDICLQSVNFILTEVRLALNFTEWLEKNRFLNFSIQMTLDLSRNGLKRVLLSL